MSGFAVQSGQTFLFIGDSITDAGRRAAAAPMGEGYAALFRDLVMAHYPELDITFINKGLGGNRITDLRERWHDDVIRHKPDWLSVHIGINDVHSFLRDPGTGVAPYQFREDYTWILQQTKQHTSAEIILLDPFYISLDESGQTFRSRVNNLIPQYIETVHQMSEQFDTRLIKLDDIFKAHLKYRDSESFCAEPVHPGRTGHLIIASALFDALLESAD